jgi:outer membrane protein assembly factor BamB
MTFRLPFFATLASLIVGTALPAFAASTLTASPSSGHPNLPVSVSGTGFGDNEAVDVYVDLTDVLLLVASSTGTISTSVTIPASASPGTHYITAIGRHSGDAAQKAFSVTTPWAETSFGYAHQAVNPFENTLTASNIASAGTLWTNTAPGGGGTVAVVGGRAYVSLKDGVEAMSTSTGAQAWKSISGTIFYASPTVLGGVVYVGDASDGKMYALNASTGATIWSVTLSGQIFGSAEVVNGIVYVGGAATAYALKATTGAILWTYQTNSFIESTPTVVDGVAYFGSNDHKVYALNATTGSMIWSYTTGGAVESSAAVYNGVVYIGSDDEKVYAIAARGPGPGSLLWSYTTGGEVFEMPAVYGSQVFVGSGDGKMYALSSQTGALQWVVNTGADVRGAAVANGLVYFTSDTNEIYAALTSNGEVVATASTGAAFFGSPSISDGVVYLSTLGGSTYAFSLASTANTGAVRPIDRPLPASLRPDFTLHVTR